MRALTLLGAALIAMSTQAFAKEWVVTKGESHIRFAVEVSGQPVTGEFLGWTSTIDFDPENLNGSSARVVIDLRSAETGDPTRDKALPSAQWFDVNGASHTVSGVGAGEAVFETASFRSTGVNAYEATGTLYMRGVTLPVTLPFVLQVSGKVARMEASLVMDRTQWGVGQGDFADETPVSSRVVVTIDLVASTP